MTKANQESSERFHYLYEKNNLPAYHPDAGQRGAPFACLVTRIDWKARVISYGLSTANTKHDVFNKKIGRHTALARLNNKPQTAYIAMNAEMIPESGHEITKLVMTHLSQSTTTPTRARQFARRWLKFAAVPKNVVTTMEDRPTIPSPAPAFRTYDDNNFGRGYTGY